MRLKDRKTGEIPEKIESLCCTEDGRIMLCYINNGIRELEFYDSLSALNEKWGEYEEPKEYWLPMSDEPYPFVGNDWEKEGLATGLISLSKEENDKKRKRLKAWKRLKDKGFKFEGIREDYTKFSDRHLPFRDGTRYLHFNKSEDDEWMKENWKDLDICFGGKE